MWWVIWITNEDCETEGGSVEGEEGGEGQKERTEKRVPESTDRRTHMVHSPPPVNNQLDLLPSSILRLLFSLLELNEMNGSQSFPQDVQDLVALVSLLRVDEPDGPGIAGLSSSLREKHGIQELDFEDLACGSGGEVGGSDGGGFSSILLVLRGRRSWGREGGSRGDDDRAEGLEEGVAWMKRWKERGCESV